MTIIMKRSSVMPAVALLLASTFHADADGPARLGENNPLTPPFCETFDNFRQGMEHDDFERYFQVIDANGDNRSWALYNYAQAIPYGRCALLHYPGGDVITADDWLLTRAVRLEAGKYYLINLDARLYINTTPNLAQRFEVKVGTYNDADGMKTTVIPAVDIHSSTFSHHQGWFSPRATGLYYIGIHGISPAYDPYYNYLFIDNIAVDAPKTGNEPGPVVVTSVANDPDGTSKVSLKFVAPSSDIAGKTLSESVVIVLTRDGEDIETYRNVSPGADLSFEDVNVEEGEHLYRFSVSNSAGEGESISLRHIAGIGAPLPPAEVTLTETADHNVLVSWTAPQTDVKGNVINPEKLTYSLYDISTETPEFAGETLEGQTSILFEPYVAAGTQTLAHVAVVAKMNDKESAEAFSKPMPLGTPYGLPYTNSFTMEDYVNKIMIIEDGNDQLTWRMLDDHSDPHAQDDDNGYVCMIGTQPGDNCELVTGKIFLDADDISMSFYTYVYSEDENMIEVYVTDCETGDKISAGLIDLRGYSRVGWNHIRLDLSDFAHKVVQIGLRGRIVTHGYIPVDNMRITTVPKIDLEVTGVNYPTNSPTGTPFEITATVTNHGTAQSGPLTAALLCDGKQVATVAVGTIGRDQSREVSLTHAFSSVSQPMARFQVAVEHPDDAYPEDNISQPFQIAMEVPSLPVPASLVADKDVSGSVTLSWSAPDLSKAAPAAQTEGFESCEPFKDLGQWTTIDADGGYVGGFQGYEMPVDNTQQGFWVMDGEEYFFIVPHSGTKAAVQMYGFKDNDRHTTPMDCDDWLVSPELYGGPQTISFWASSYNNDYGLEVFEVYASSTGTEIEDFHKVMDLTEAPVEWTRFLVTLPDGTRHFAIRCTSSNVFMMLVDDIEFTPAGEALPLVLKGYKVYLNEECLSGPEPISATSFKVAAPADGDRLNVTAVYDKGESIPATIVNGSASVGSIFEDAGDGPVEYFNLQGMKVGEGSLLPGIYIRRTTTKAEKVVIR